MVPTLGALEGLFERLLAAVFGAAGILLFVMIVVGGFQFITSGGDPKKLEGAKNTLTYAFIGVVMTALAFLLLVLLSRITGNTNLLNFEIIK